MPSSKVRVTFSCDAELKKELTKKAENQGIPRSQLIVELLELAMGGDGKGTSPEVNRFLYDVQQRLLELESWRREINDWKRSSSENTENLETTIAEILNEQLTESEHDKEFKDKKIPQPK